MNPSAKRPVSSSALGPYPATHTGSFAPSGTHGIRIDVPSTSTGRPSASSRITWTASASRASVVGLRPCTRTAESPRPIPQIVRLPCISFSVACSDAITVQSRVAGLVTIGPTTSREVRASTCEWITYGSCQSTCESNVQPWLNPSSSARTSRSTTADPAGRSAARARRPWSSPHTRYWHVSRFRNRPCPAAPRYSPSSTTTRPRDSTVRTRPVISRPS